MRFNHDPENHVRGFARRVGKLCGDVGCHDGLAFVVFVGVAVGAVDHEAGLEVGFGEGLAGFLDVGGRVIGSGVAAAENDVACVVAGGVDNGGDALFGDGEEVVVHGRGADGVDGDGDVAVGAVFEAHGDRETGSELTVHLGFGGSGTDCTPRDEIGDVLGRDGIEELGSRGDSRFVQV